MSKIIITDIHGCYKTLLALIAKLPKDIQLVFAGDLVDRGPDSKNVIEFIKNSGHDCIIGNHELMMIDETKFVNEENEDKLIPPSYLNGIWLMNGGDKTLDTYVNDDGSYDNKTLKKHVEWLKTLPYFIHYTSEVDEDGQALLVTHSTAGRVWGTETTDSERFKDYVTWARDSYPPKIKDIFNVYGHTPQRGHPTITDHFVCIDGGAAYTAKDFGKLYALQFPEMIVYTQENVEDKK